MHPANSPGVRVDLLPGLQFRYSGVGTTVIQLLLEEVTGTSATEVLDRLVKLAIERYERERSYAF